MTYLLLQKYTKILPREMEQELWHWAYWWFVKWGLLREELESSSNPWKATLKCSKSVHVTLL
jgi:D-alanyl-lipoteichoic acid acyltransferase DltB (MBOAT superfamily)